MSVCKKHRIQIATSNMMQVFTRDLSWTCTEAWVVMTKFSYSLTVVPFALHHHFRRESKQTQSGFQEAFLYFPFAVFQCRVQPAVIFCQDTSVYHSSIPRSICLHADLTGTGHSGGMVHSWTLFFRTSAGLGGTDKVQKIFCSWVPGRLLEITTLLWLQAQVMVRFGGKWNKISKHSTFIRKGNYILCVSFFEK